MNDAKREARGGRPRISDHLVLYMFVESGRRKLKLTVRQFCARRDAKFERLSTLRGRQAEKTFIKGETLRRRYREARVAIGLTNPHPHVTSTAFVEFQTESKLLLNKMIEDYNSE